MRRRPARLILALAALAVTASPAPAQERIKPKPVEGVPQPQTPSPIKPAAAAPPVTGAPAIASPAPWVRDLPQDQDSAARIGGLADEQMGGADCRTACASSYYNCLTQDDSSSCSAEWTTCLVACPPVSAGE